MEIRGLVQGIDRCLERVRGLLEATVVCVDGRKGWRQFLDEGGSPGTYGSACGLIAYANIPSGRRDLIVDVSSTIVSRQQDDGSWASPTIVENVGLTTATAYSLLALEESRVPVDDQVLSKAVAWLEGVVAGDGATGDYMGQTEYNTTCAAMTLRALGHRGELALTKRVMSWLLSCRQNGAGWGYHPNSESTVDHTALAVVGLASAGHASESGEIGEAIEWLKARYVVGGGENNQRQDLKYVVKDDSRRLLPYHFFTDGVVGLAYLAVVKHYDLIERVIEIAQHLVDTQAEDGHWVHAGVPEKQPSWAIAEAVLFLSGIKMLLVEEGRLLSLEQWGLDANHQIEELRQELEKVEKRTRGIPVAIDILRLWPLHIIYIAVLFYIAIRVHIPASPWIDIVMFVVALLVTILISYFFRDRKGKGE